MSGTPAPQQWKLNIVMNQGGGGGSINLTAVPEPSAAFLLGGLLAVSVARRRTRRAA